MSFLLPPGSRLILSIIIFQSWGVGSHLPPQPPSLPLSTCTQPTELLRDLNSLLHPSGLLFMLMLFLRYLPWNSTLEHSETLPLKMQSPLKYFLPLPPLPTWPPILPHSHHESYWTVYVSIAMKPQLREWAWGQTTQVQILAPPLHSYMIIASSLTSHASISSSIRWR